jgi:protein phosphatase
MLHLEDVSGKRIIDTRLQRNVTVREENATAALEVMSRFAADPRWLIYLPPTMSPCETSTRPDMLEHPAEAFDYFRSRGVDEVVCEEKHMGSRAVVIVCRDADAARDRFGITTGEIGICYTRTGRRFFDEAALEAAFLERLRDAATAAGLWEEFDTTWMCLDCELMPWSAKARALLRDQYAAVGSAARFALDRVVPLLHDAQERLVDEALNGLADRYAQRQLGIEQYTRAYRQYCWTVQSLDDFRLAPFHLLATRLGVHVDQDHLWHMATLQRLAEHDDLLMATNHRLVSLSDVAGVQNAIGWWETLTGSGGEGMVVKPREFIARGRRGLLQPAVKCRGPEYLRIIYGPEYLAPQHLDRLRNRSLKHKRSLALREFSLGIEALERFVRGEPLRRTHECVFGVLAMESEPVDPRL